jgi:hypothetical protein
VTALLAQTDGIETYQVTLGSGGGLCIGGGGTNIATFSATVADDAPVFEVSDRLREAFGDLTGAGEIKVEAGGGGGFSATAVQVIVQADDPLTLRTAAEQGRGAVAGAPDVVDVTSVLASSAPRIDVKVDRLAATRAGLTEAATGRAVAAAMRGTPLGQLTVDGATRCVVSGSRRRRTTSSNCAHCRCRPPAASCPRAGRHRVRSGGFGQGCRASAGLISSTAITPSWYRRSTPWSSAPRNASRPGARVRPRRPLRPETANRSPSVKAPPGRRRARMTWYGSSRRRGRGTRRSSNSSGKPCLVVRWPSSRPTARYGPRSPD